MFFKILEKLRAEPEEYRQRVAIGITVFVGLVLIPVWFWNFNHSGFSLRGSVAETSESTGPNWSEFEGLDNPFNTINRVVQDRFHQPISVLGKNSTDREVTVTVQIKNEALAELFFPQNNIYLQNAESHEESHLVQKVTDHEGRQLVPVIPAGETREATLYFPPVESGQYSIVFPDLKYDDEDYVPFSQVVEVEIRAFWLPRS